MKYRISYSKSKTTDTIFGKVLTGDGAEVIASRLEGSKVGVVPFKGFADETEFGAWARKAALAHDKASKQG